MECGVKIGGSGLCGGYYCTIREAFQEGAALPRKGYARGVDGFFFTEGLLRGFLSVCREVNWRMIL
jgi:hypothetical protein